MTDQEIIQALRCTSTPGGPTGNCEKCPYYRRERLEGELKEKLGTDTWTSCDVDKVGMDAADLIARLTAENAALREAHLQKDKIQALFKEKLDEFEAERDTAIADLADIRSCRVCKHVCDTRDCSSCQDETCKCRNCGLDKHAWEWRGVSWTPVLPNEGGLSWVPGSLGAEGEQPKKIAAGDENAELREKVPQWISVKERLPEPGVPVLVNYIGTDGLPSADGVVVWTDWGALWWEGSLADSEDEVSVPITHWMPLPGAPEEGDKHE